MKRRGHVGVVLGTLALVVALSAAPVTPQPDETAGMITEIKVGRGTVEVKAADGDWRRASPLSALRAGDQVRAVNDAMAVVLLTGGRGAVLVKAKNSPYAVAAPRTEESAAGKARSLLSTTIDFLVSGPKEAPKAVTSSRSAARPPEILTPRNGLILPGSLVFEWLGDRFSRYHVRIMDPSAVVLERKGVVGARFAYPADAKPLKPGVRYRVEVKASGFAPAEAWFELMDETRAAQVRANLEQLEAGLGPRVSPSSRSVVRAGTLAAEGLYHDARLVTLAALAEDPDEPTLHMVLGNLYLKTGLRQLGAQSLDDARSLLTRDKK